MFRSLLAKWKPEAVVVAGFGQLIDTPIIQYPDYGIYNVHPADLRNGYGAGPDPWGDLVTRRAQTMRVSIHQVSEEIDAGSVVGVSPSVNVRLAEGECTDDVRLIGEKTFMPVKAMVEELVRRLCSNWESDCPCTINRMDLESCFSLPEKEALMRPIDPEKRGTLLPLSPLCVRDTV
ncbi:formyltransferase family protein [Maridesulfovibrio ferrireducens]|uniref:formyltransferase family protein n=1 Tax=Maridesulfovibrio ferrireducens TaxID=246191 RepID=UPI00147FBD4A|nr:formyltransferase family protein [Maridesulfovibrio ferrireducens]